MRTTFSKLAAECLPLSHCTTAGDPQPSPQTVIALQIPWKDVFWPQISRCLLQNPKRSLLIGGLGVVVPAPCAKVFGSVKALGTGPVPKAANTPETLSLKAAPVHGLKPAA
jgi:hypothetical protein